MEYSHVYQNFVAYTDVLTQEGRRAAQDGKPPLNLEDFVRRIDQNEDFVLAELMYECYMKGYNAGKAVA